LQPKKDYVIVKNNKSKNSDEKSCDSHTFSESRRLLQVGKGRNLSTFLAGGENRRDGIPYHTN